MKLLPLARRVGLMLCSYFSFNPSDAAAGEVIERVLFWCDAVCPEMARLRHRHARVSMSGFGTSQTFVVGRS